MEEYRSERQQRHHKLLKARSEICDAVDLLLKNCGITNASKNITEVEYTDAIAKVLVDIDHLADGHRALFIARRHLQHRASDVIHSAQLKVLPPNLPIRMKRTAPLADEAWFKNAREIWAWNEAFAVSLAGLSEGATSSEHLLGLILYSAASRGFLCEPILWDSLKKRILTDVKPLKITWTGQWYLDLTVDVKLGPGNIYDDNRIMRVKSWCPDAVTLGLILQFLELKMKPGRAAASFELIKNAVWPDGKNTSKITTGKLLATACLWSNINRTADVSFGLAQIASFKTPSLSLDTVSAEALKKQTHSPFVMAMATKPERPRNEVGRDEKPDPGQEWAQIKQALSLTTTGEKLSREQYRKQIISLLDVTVPDSIAHALLKWFEDLLGTQKLKPSTIKRYHSSISRYCLYVFEGVECSRLDGTDFYDLYNAAINLQSLEKERVYLSDRIEQFHSFGVLHMGWPILPENLVTGSKAGQFVRARLIPLSAYQAMRTSIQMCFSHYSLLAESLEVLIILAYRTGLRLGELTKLRVGDIQLSDKTWLMVRNNRYGDNKTLSAMRLIPLRILLTREEYAIFTKFFNRRAMEVTEGHVLLQDGAVEAPLDRDWVSHTCNMLMRSILGDQKWTFHHFRHTAVSHVYLAIEGEYEAAERLAGWKIAQAELIDRAIVSSERSSLHRYWALSAFAGHSSPRQTFLSYVHLSDIVLGLKMQRAPINLDLKQVSSVVRRPVRAVGGVIYDHHVLDLIAPMLRKHCISEIHDEQIEVPGDLKVSSFNDVKVRSLIDQFYIMFNTLRWIEDGLSLGLACERTGVEIAVGRRWHNRAIELSHLTTRKNESRVFSKDRKLGSLDGVDSVSQLLLPFRPVDRHEQKDVKEILLNLEKTYVSQSRELASMMLYCVNHSSPNKSGIRFSDPGQLEKFISLFSGCVPAARWHVFIHLRDTPSKIRDMEAWARSAGGAVLSWISSQTSPKGKGKNPSGHAILHLRHPNEAIIIKGSTMTKYTAKSLRFICHMLAILLPQTPGDVFF